MDAKYIQQFKKGSLEMMLLSLIAHGETYGHEILTALNETCADVMGYAKEGTVYPILYRLELSGLISNRVAVSDSRGGSRKYYSITEAGKKALSELVEFWRRYSECVNNIIDL